MPGTVLGVGDTAMDKTDRFLLSRVFLFVFILEGKGDNKANTYMYYAMCLVEISALGKTKEKGR